MQIATNRHGLLLSVQRTGTRFVQRILQQAGIKPAQLHAAQAHMDRIEIWLEKCRDEGLPIIIPLRHPISVAKSWRVRGEPLEAMFDQWALLAEIVDVSRPLFLPVDHPERDEFLREMSGQLNMDLQTRWKKYGSKPGSNDVVLTPVDTLAVQELIANTFLKYFYTEDVPHGT